MSLSYVCSSMKLLTGYDRGKGIALGHCYPNKPVYQWASTIVRYCGWTEQGLQAYWIYRVNISMPHTGATRFYEAEIRFETRFLVLAGSPVRL